MKNKILKIFLMFIIVSICSSQNLFPILGGQRVGTSVFSFLNIGVSARAIGMGESVVALNHGASNVSYNPSAIAQLEKTEISLSTINWPSDIKYDYLSASKRLFGRHFLGFNLGILHMEPMLETSEFYPDGTGNYFIFQDRFIGLTYGAKMTDRFSFGVTLKHVSEKLAENEMNAFLLDVGTFYWTGFGSLRFCASLTNFGKQASPSGNYPKNLLDSGSGSEIVEVTSYEKFSPPTLFRVGVAFDPIQKINHKVSYSLQLNHPVDNAEYIATGLEYSFVNLLFLRSGYKFNKKEENYTVGIGLNINIGSYNLKVDYGYANFDHLSDPKRFSISLVI
jgi:hypothetical protein|tara:strand:- start:1304 stop:2311 length:1008 start_codon:yes stop_codon:yes gene_type:complete